jgi:two-component system phosphate regulon sensor histidine kinase PhoR
MVWVRNLVFIVVLGLIAYASRHALGDTSAWIFFCVGILLQLHWHVAQLERVSKWSEDLRRPPPVTTGSWDDLLARLYKYHRSQERLLFEAEEGLQGAVAAAQALPDGVVTLDDGFHILWCNRIARQHLGLRIPADQGQNLLNLMRAPDFVRYASQDTWNEPLLVRSPASNDRLLMVQLIVYGRGQRMILTRDVTQIEKLETTRRDFVANVSHELRTPLTVLAGFLETLKDMPDEALSAAQREQYMSMMLEQAQRMQAIVADLLTLSALEASPSAEPHPVGMRMLLEAARQQAEPLSAGRHRFVWNVDESLEVLGTASELGSAVTNLLVNAVRYTPDGGTITISWQREASGGARYQVVDTGIGIAAHHLPRLAERFYRVDRSRSRESGGTGLGLAITKHVAMRHDGELQIASEVGKGSTFSIVFPAERVTTAEDDAA